MAWSEHVFDQSGGSARTCQSTLHSAVVVVVYSAVRTATREKY